jgi:lipopolysaccharide/colanic/teichoic acid biosynthesis glycosyltransferase
MVIPEAWIVQSMAEMKKMLIQKLRERFNLFQSNRNQAKRGGFNEIHSVEKFRLLLERERVRTERTCHEFSLVVFKTKYPSESSVDQEGLVKTLMHRIRFTDEVGWFGEKEIGVILVNTSTEGAYKFAEHILQGIPDAAFIQSFKIYTYPTRCQTDHEGDFNKFQLPDHRRQLNHSMFQELFGNPLLSSEGHEEPRGRTLDGMEQFLVRSLPRWKRIVDIVGSTIGLLLFSPLMVIAAASIKLTSSGPILFRQERIGFLGRRFTLLKFRTMVHNNDPDIHKKYIENFIKKRVSVGEHTNPSRIYKINNDPRVTFVGKLLRKTSLDELPQFINVLKGEMSLVGPRPPIHYEYEQYDIWHKRRAWEVKPGITGLWQIKGRSKTTFDQMARLDLKYLKEWSLWLDLKILIQTPWAVFTGKGAY